MRKNVWAVCAAALLTAFTTYLALDTFVLSRSYVANATGMNLSLFEEQEESRGSAVTAEAGETSGSGQAGDADPSETAGDGSGGGTDTGRGRGPGKSRTSSASGGRSSRKDSGASQEPSGAASESASGGDTIRTDDCVITLTEYERYDTRIYVADVTLSSAQYLKTAFAEDTYGRNVTATTSSIAQSNGALLAINGDYYGVQERGYVIRNGIVYRDTPKGCDVLCIYADGTMDVVSDRERTADELVAEGVWQAFSFGPALVEDGSVAVGVNTEVGKAMASNPRTAIGLVAPNHFVFVVSDGRTSESEGLSLYELAEFLWDLGVQTAYNLDGGGSSTMYFDGAVVNQPTTGGSIREREISDIVYIGAR